MIVDGSTIGGAPPERAGSAVGDVARSVNATSSGSITPTT
jgi:hypothetical protein